ncbi:1-deoxy-D-xylulose 5-phosphate reductoisomerase [subsurface metagenome]
MVKRKIVVLGSTGSVGINTLRVVESLGDRFQIIGLTARKNINLLEKQIKKFHPKIVALADKKSAQELYGRFKSIRILSGQEGVIEVARLKEADLVVSAIVGASGLIPTLEAIKAKKTLALANKEALVMAGEIVMQEIHKRRVGILPVDSEHSAIFQCLKGERKEDVSRIILTASGGPFLNFSLKRLKLVTPQEALKHPAWEMGKKITIDSATLMNKGLEVIEAHHLFGIDIDRIEVVIHREAIVHSLVEFVDGAMLAHLGTPDMRLPIQYALTYPERLPTPLEKLDLTKIRRLTFQKPDTRKFPCLKLAYEAARIGGTAPAVLNATNEIAVSLFLKKKIGFMEIPRMIKKVLNGHKPIKNPALSEILKADAWAREEALRC